MRYSFFSVSKSVNIPYIIENLKQIKSLYGECEYTAIVPDAELSDFMSTLNANSTPGIQILPESRLLSYSSFRHIISLEKESSGKSIPESLNLGWYYQQALKLSYALQAELKRPLVMIDADTILLQPIQFTDSSHSNIFVTPYERHNAYRIFCLRLFREELNQDWNSCTSQFFSLTHEEQQSLRKRLNEVQPISYSDTVGIWITKILAKVLIDSADQMPGERFLMSEQDLIGYSNLLSGSNYKCVLFFVRAFTGTLSPAQIYASKLLGIAHITYEQWLVSDNKSRLSWYRYGKIVARSFKIYLKERFKTRLA